MSTALDVRLTERLTAPSKPPPLELLPSLSFEELRPGTILLAGNTALPPTMKVRFRHLLGWRTPVGLDAFGFERRLTELGWRYFFIVPSIRKTVLGFRRDRALRRALAALFRKVEEQGFNSLEVVDLEVTKWLFIHRVQLTTHARHVLNRPFLREPSRYQRPPRVWDFSGVFDKLNRGNPNAKAA